MVCQQVMFNNKELYPSKMVSSSLVVVVLVMVWCNNIDFRWKKVATLKTNGVPITEAQFHKAISVYNNKIFTGRHDYYGGYGMVFVHDMNKH